jgi:2-dehydropantoate 2-reductase
VQVNPLTRRVEIFELRAANVARTLSPAIETRVTANMRGAVWAKLLLNCSVTTLGAIAARTLRQYIA